MGWKYDVGTAELITSRNEEETEKYKPENYPKLSV
jgi:hypothetical protein